MPIDKDTNLAELTDEEINGIADPELLLREREEVEQETSNTEEDSKEETSTEKETKEELKTEEESQDIKEEDGVYAEESVETTGKTQQNPAEQGDSKGTDESALESKESAAPSSESAINYEAEYKRIMAPFIASGKEMQVSTVEDVISLMQMGANYNKKMEKLNPNLKLIKMLENNELLDEKKLSYLIDLDKKNPEAITKLLKESGIDPLEVDVNNASKYTPGSYQVDERDIIFDSVVQDLQGTDGFDDMLKVIGDTWDDKSKQSIYDNANLLRDLTSHKQTGLFDKVLKVIGHERMLGRLNGISDIDAYKYVGETLLSNNAVNTASNGKEDTTNNVNKQVAESDSELKERKMAANPTRQRASSTGKVNSNLLSLSDDEFLKMDSGKFI